MTDLRFALTVRQPPDVVFGVITTVVLIAGQERAHRSQLRLAETTLEQVLGKLSPGQSGQEIHGVFTDALWRRAIEPVQNPAQAPLRGFHTLGHRLEKRPGGVNSLVQWAVL